MKGPGERAQKLILMPHKQSDATKTFWCHKNSLVPQKQNLHFLYPIFGSKKLCREHNIIIIMYYMQTLYLMPLITAPDSWISEHCTKPDCNKNI